MIDRWGSLENGGDPLNGASDERTAYPFGSLDSVAACMYSVVPGGNVMDLMVLAMRKALRSHWIYDNSASLLLDKRQYGFAHLKIDQFPIGHNIQSDARRGPCPQTVRL